MNDPERNICVVGYAASTPLSLTRSKTYDLPVTRDPHSGLFTLAVGHDQIHGYIRRSDMPTTFTEDDARNKFTSIITSAEPPILHGAERLAAILAYAAENYPRLTYTVESFNAPNAEQAFTITFHAAAADYVEAIKLSEIPRRHLEESEQRARELERANAVLRTQQQITLTDPERDFIENVRKSSLTIAWHHDGIVILPKS